MKLLLDTHIWLWSQDETKKLSRRVARAIDDSRNELWTSPASIWEILGLWRKGRIKLSGGPSVWFPTSFSRVAYREAPFTNEVALALDSFTLPHSDPIDAILVASAKVYGLTLVTADTKILDAKACPMLSNL